jgi:hypothetical protein
MGSRLAQNLPVNYHHGQLSPWLGDMPTHHTLWWMAGYVALERSNEVHQFNAVDPPKAWCDPGKNCTTFWSPGIIE